MVHGVEHGSGRDLVAEQPAAGRRLVEAGREDAGEAEVSDKLYRVYIYTEELVSLVTGRAEGWVFPEDTEFHAWQKDEEGDPVLLLASDEPFTAHGLRLE